MNTIHLPPVAGPNGYEPGPEVQGHSGTLYWPHKKAAPQMGSVVEGDDGVLYSVCFWLPGQSRVEVLDEGVETCDAMLRVARGCESTAAVCKAYIHNSPFAGRSSTGDPVTIDVDVLKKAVKYDNIVSDGWNPQIPEAHCYPEHTNYSYVVRRMVRKGWILQDGSLNPAIGWSGGF